jgi:undecaprenyl diphosphate synthase
MSIPKHVAIIMDGNGRWAKNRNLPRNMGHKAGSDALSKIIESSAKLGIKALTLYAFSTENWKRSEKEVNALMNLMEKALKENTSKLKKNNIRFNSIGRVNELRPSLLNLINDAKETTKDNEGMILTLAINYGGRQEIIDTVKNACKNYQGNSLDISDLDEETFSKFLYTEGLPELDLIIRTSGEMRLSNFLLWQSAYAEIYVTDTLWPDFNEDALKKAIEEYEKRERRFGE